MTMALLPETPEVENWVREVLREGGVQLYSVEGYSVKENIVTALFERRKSTVRVEKWSRDEISNWFATKEDRNAWVARSVLARCLRVPLYLVVWQERAEDFRILSLTVNNMAQIRVIDEELFNSCEDLAEWLSNLKGIPVSKKFVEPGRLSSIDECLRLYGVPWPGNLDGFILSKTTRKVKAIFEFSRTRKFPVISHNLNLYFSQDINRWKPLNILRKQLNVPLYIVIWSSTERLVKIHKLLNITDSGLQFESTELLAEEQLVPQFNQILK